MIPTSVHLLGPTKNILFQTPGSRSVPANNMCIHIAMAYKQKNTVIVLAMLWKLLLHS